jgi:23S rRNA pseudouridine1911/1915/1917 synthase
MTPRERPAGRPAARWVEHAVTAEEAGASVSDVLTGALGVSRRMIQRLTRSQGIRLNRRPTFLARKVREGDVVAARLAGTEEERLPPVEMHLEVVHEDADLLVVGKPPFLLVHPTSPEQDRTLAHGVAFHYRARGLAAKVRPVHRIDRDTSGLVLFAKTQHAHHQLDRQLREGTLRREYLALVHGSVERDEGEIDAPIGRHGRHPHLRAVDPAGERALTRYRVEERYPEATLLRLVLDTGRTHQIRVHLAHAGHPVIGDRQYGGRVVGGLARQALHAARLAFRHPTSGEEMGFELELPEDLARLRDHLRAPGPPPAGD